MAEPQKNIDFDGPQMQGTHYKRADMAGSHFDGVNLADAQFYACLRKARFTDTNLSEAVFDDINLADASFNNVNLSGAAITNANLSRLTISGVTLADTDIKDADLTGMRINGVLITDLFHSLGTGEILTAVYFLANGAERKTACRLKRSLGLVRHLNNVAFGSVAFVSYSIPNDYWPHVYFSELRPWYLHLLQVCFSAFDITPVQLHGVVMFRLLDEIA